MPARPDVIDADLEPFTGELTSQFDLEDVLVSGDFAEVRAAGGASCARAWTARC